MPQNYKEKFYGVIEGMFLGDVKDIEGEGGFMNLLKIKKIKITLFKTGKI